MAMVFSLFFVFEQIIYKYSLGKLNLVRVCPDAIKGEKLIDTGCYRVDGLKFARKYPGLRPARH